MSLQRLAALAQSMQGAGERFFETLVQELTALLGVRRAEVLELVGPERAALRAIAIWDRGPCNVPDFAPMRPYLDVLENSQILVERDVQQACPENRQLAELGVVGYLGTPLVGRSGQVLGCLALLDDRPLDLSGQPDLVAQLFAPFAAAEIERRQDLQSGPGADAVPDEVLAALSHELRDQLSGIVNAADVLRQTAGTDQQSQWAAQVMDRQLHYMVGLIDDLGAVSELARGTLELQFEHLDLEQLVRQAIETVRPEAALRRLDLTLETDLGPVPVRGDRTRLLQVMTRLLDSAVRNTSFAGAVAVAVRLTGAQAEVYLTHRQPAPEDAAPPPPDRPDLGLMLVRRLIELHAGTLVVAGGLAGGPTQPMPIVLRLPSVARAPLAARRIMVVDDDHDSAFALGRALEKRGHVVRVVHTGKAALEGIPGFRPDAVFLDIGLPGQDGLEVARRIRAIPEQSEVTLVAATGRGWSEDRQRSFQAGFDHHLVKPLALEDVEAALAQGRTGAARRDVQLS